MRRRILGGNREGETPIDISNAVFVQESSLVLTGTNQKQLIVTEDGTKLFYSQANVLYRYDFGTPYDVSTLTYAYNSGTLNAGIEGWTMKPDGTRIFCVNYNQGLLQSYDLTTPFDVRTKVAGQIGTINQPSNLCVSPTFSIDGTKLYVLYNGTPDWISEYSLSTPWDISTLAFIKNVLGLGTITNSLKISDTGKFIYHSNVSMNAISQIPLSTPYDTGTSQGEILFPYTNIKTAEILEQARKIYILNGVTFKISEYNV